MASEVKEFAKIFQFIKMASLLTEVHREIPEANRDLAKAVLDVKAKERRTVRREGKGGQQEHDMRSSPSATTEELEAVRSELAARINRCLYGEGTVFDRRFKR